MNRLYRQGWTGWQSFGLLVLRVVVGTAFILHGWPKIQNPTSWMGDGAHPILQLAAAVAEFGGGIALILGFLTPLVAAAIAINMVFAMGLVHFPKGDPFVARGGGGSYELALVYFAIMIALLATGPGRFSLDAAVWGRGREVAVGERETWRKPAAA
jgi:putative oxidoreductase